MRFVGQRVLWKRHMYSWNRFYNFEQKKWVIRYSGKMRTWQFRMRHYLENYVSKFHAKFTLKLYEQLFLGKYIYNSMKTLKRLLHWLFSLETWYRFLVYLLFRGVKVTTQYFASSRFILLGNVSTGFRCTSFWGSKSDKTIICSFMPYLAWKSFYRVLVYPFLRAVKVTRQ